jgi:hypothetical protein
VTARLPNFLLIGATKCGTTSLHDWLTGHPEIWMPPDKELRYFTAEHRLARGPDWYAAQFAPAPPNAVIGEASNAYTRHPVYDGVPGRIAAMLPDARLIYMIRDPMARIESHYRHRLVTGIEWRPPARAIRADPRYRAASLYGHQVARYLEHFPARNLLVLQMETLSARPEAELARVGAFLGIDPAQGPAFRRRNETAARRVAPWPLRRLGGFAATKPRAKDLAARLARSEAGRWLTRADRPGFALDAALRAELESAFEADARLLARLLPTTVLAPEAEVPA